MGSNNIDKSYLMQILENSPDGIFTIDTDLNIRYVNPAFCRILGFTEDELLGTPITTYLGDLRILDVCMAEVSKNGKCNDQETIFNRKDGSIIHISKNVQAMTNDDGSFREILVSIRDMTELHALNNDLANSKDQLETYNFELEQTLDNLRKTQKKLIESEKMASLGGLVAGLAHEINTPLGIGVTSASTMHDELNTLKIKFNNGTLTRSSMDDFFEHFEKLCTILGDNLLRASDLIQSFKQVAVDQTLDEWREIDLRQYCDEILISLGPKFKKTAITIHNKCDEDINFLTNAGAIYQIFSNLLLNSLIHAYEEQKEGQITIEAHSNRDCVNIDFLDDGKGISADNLKQIFEPFYTTRRGVGGSGLGLSIVYNLVTSSLNGSISAESNEGHGVHFSIKLPISDK